jgi:cell division protein FtsB
MIQKIKRIKKRESHQTIFFSIFLGCLILIVVGFLITSNLKINQKRAELNTQIEGLKKEIQALEEKKQELETGISQAKKEEYLEKEAREKLDLKKPGEEVIVVKTLPPAENQEEKTAPKKNFLGKILEKFKFW